MPKPAITEEDVVETVRQAVFMLRMANPDIRFVDDLPPGPLTADFDRRLLSQAVTNIVKNATEAIAAVPEDERGEPRIDVGVRVEGEQILVDVTDTGKGFPAEGRQRLLEPYMTTRDGGTGLGLAIVGKILEDHGGRIELLDNPAGRGGRVRLVFPLKQSAPAGAEPTAEAATTRRMSA
jgi:two-component system nitrogen regulation sensor histidine kinase NtrY